MCFYATVRRFEGTQAAAWQLKTKTTPKAVRIILAESKK